MWINILQVLEDDKQWWKLRNRSGQAGYVPFNMLDVVKIEEPEGPYNQVTCLLYTLCGDLKLSEIVNVIV